MSRFCQQTARRRAGTVFAMGLCLGLFSAHPIAAGENYALLVAVGDYDLKELRPLKYTRADVLELHRTLGESGYPASNIVLMHDDVEGLVSHYKKQGGNLKVKDYLPLAANIRKELELLLGRLRPDDSVVLAFSGHGVQFKGEKKSYYCPSDAKLDQKESLIAFEEIYSALKESAAGRKLLLIDACQNDPQSEIGKSRKTVDLDSITRPQTEALPEGIIALFSCRAGQKSFEIPDLGHGVFFYHLLDAWKGKADANRDGKLTYQELAVYTEKNTAEYAAKNLKVLQTPQLRAEFSGEWVLREMTLKPRPNNKGIRALLVGVNDYDSPALSDLKFCESDVNALAAAFQTAGCLPQDLVILSDSTGRKDSRFRPSRANILREVRRLSEGDPVEKVFVAFAGQGCQFNGTAAPYFLPCDANPKDIASLLPLKEIETELESNPADLKVVLVDMCREDPSGKTTLVAPEGAKNWTPLGEQGVVVLQSCSYGQQSYENASSRHGAFTYALLDAMKGKADDNQNGHLTLQELSRYLNTVVPRLAREWINPRTEQNPEIRFGQVSGLKTFVKVPAPEKTN